MTRKLVMHIQISLPLYWWDCTSENMSLLLRFCFCLSRYFNSSVYWILYIHYIRTKAEDVWTDRIARIDFKGIRSVHTSSALFECILAIRYVIHLLPLFECGEYADRIVRTHFKRNSICPHIFCLYSNVVNTQNELQEHILRGMPYLILYSNQAIAMDSRCSSAGEDGALPERPDRIWDPPAILSNGYRRQTKLKWPMRKANYLFSCSA
jgi:hypothetical protein